LLVNLPTIRRKSEWGLRGGGYIPRSEIKNRRKRND
jgi:hypothetical protein